MIPGTNNLKIGMMVTVRHAEDDLIPQWPDILLAYRWPVAQNEASLPRMTVVQIAIVHQKLTMGEVEKNLHRTIADQQSENTRRQNPIGRSKQFSFIHTN